jgi:hypothetical protein
MQRKKIVLSLSIALAVAVGWYLFRPERLFLNERVHEDFPTAGAHSPSATPIVLARGNFHGVAHQTTGTATIYRLADGKRVLRLTDFETSNGPDVRVYLGVAPDANDNETVKQAGFVEISPLKGNVGDQNYELPTDVDLAQYHSVTIWCKRFGVNFATAPLAGPST